MQENSTIMKPLKRRKAISAILKVLSGIAVLNLLPVRISAFGRKKQISPKIKAIEHPLAVKYGNKEGKQG